MTKKLVVVGNGMAAGRAIERRIEAEPGAYDITIFNAEPRVNYDRIMLSPVLSGEKAYEDILIHDDAWYEINKVNLIKNCKVTEIDRNAKTVTGADGTVADYDKLLIATGSYPFIIPVPGHDLDGVLAYRDLDDVENMIKAAKKPGSRAVVIGGGLLGLEAAYGLKMQGMEVTVLHLMPTLMERQLDEAAGYLLEKAITQRGINIITRANTKAILGVDSVQSVQLDDGRIIPADIVVMAVGIKPNMHLADDAGLETGRGVLVNDNMVTSDPDILSVGECVEHRGQCYGLVAPLYEMANVVADQLSGDEASAYTGSVTSTKLKVTGIDLFSAGDFAEGEGREDI
ncbi:MAG: NAD(P)/FAD-dependent oxidoreductase, partial [Sphingomonadales bacterium]